MPDQLRPSCIAATYQYAGRLSFTARASVCVYTHIHAPQSVCSRDGLGHEGIVPKILKTVRGVAKFVLLCRGLKSSLAEHLTDALAPKVQ